MRKDNEENSTDIKTLLRIASEVKLRMKELLLFILASVILGLILAFTTPKEWVSATELLPESKDQLPLNANLGGLASLAGFDLDTEAGLNPELYPNISNSTPFLMELASKEFYFSRLDATISLRDYLLDKKKKSLVQHLKTLADNVRGMISSSQQISTEESDYLRIGKQEETLIKELKKRINVSVNKKSGVLRISVLMQDPEVAAKIADFTESYIVNYVKDYYRQKAKLNLEFIESQLSNKKEEFEAKQSELARLIDSNFGLSTEISRIQIDKVQSEKDLLFNVYSGLAQQYEDAKIRLEESTLVFKVIEPVTIMYEKVQPKRFKTLILMMFLGGFVGLSWIIATNYLKKEIHAS